MFAGSHPPVDMHSPDGLGWAFTILFLAQIVPAGAWLVRRSLRSRSLIPVLALLGGVAAGFGEAVLDALSNIWWPTDIPLPVFTGFGVQVPSYALMGYSLFLGVGSYVVFELLRGGKGPRAIWTVAGIFFVADLLYEIPFLNLGLYDYYGPQPWDVAGFPIHWAFLNAMVVIAGGWMFFQLRDRMVGWGTLAAFVIPMAALGPLIGVAWPVFLTLHMDLPDVVRWVAGAYAIGMSLWLIRYVAGFAGGTPDAIEARRREPAVVGR